MSFLERLMRPLGQGKAHRTGRRFELGIGTGGAGFGNVEAGRIEGDAVEDAIHATDDPAEQEREEFGTEL